MLRIVFENEDLLVVNKPQGLAAASGERENLCGLLFRDRPELSFVPGHREGEGGLLNRLDNDTGGLVLFAKNAAAFSFYVKLMREEKITKIYSAVVDGIPGAKNGVIRLPVAHSKKSARRMVVADGRVPFRGRALDALSEWSLVKTAKPYSLLSVAIRKGARHQIRVHLAAIGLPIVGDRLYNRKESAVLVDRHLLFCRKVVFPRPADGCGEIEIPEPYADLVGRLPDIENKR